MKKLLLYFMFATVALCVACGDDEETVYTDITENPFTDITVNCELMNEEGVIVFDEIGASTTLQFNGVPENAGDIEEFSFRFRSGNERIFTVDMDGVITSVASGEAELSIWMVDKYNVIQLQKTCNIFVTAKVTDIVIPGDTDGLTLELGAVYDLNANVSVLPEGATDKTLSYSIKDGEDVVSLEEGILKVLAQGTAVIEIAANDNSGVKAELNITTVPWYCRDSWTVDTSIFYETVGTNYAPDGETGKPEDILDGKGETFLSLIKPGKDYGDCATPTDHLLYFVVDMKEPKSFNVIEWKNRFGNTGVTGVHLRYIRVLGSNDNVDYKVIEEKIVLDHTNIETAQLLPVKESEYRYVKVEFTGWVLNPNSALQVGDFRLGIQ
ncbi:MAG: hypothetical protein K2P55_14490 [Bacteroides acidifaciens]|uniref:discoidin domain-containing protein n=1 Tax=Bacteroides acidifaciens TaxID=85831 RepID=UPI0023C849DA|nr:hypothetical protein [Bacteroides acidifaciens]MDE6822187.1 hypothetical protein [Bacteroides acidifaciens]MDE6988083.1 hypothetical protein [Bacteroides acidifaciens]